MKYRILPLLLFALATQAFGQSPLATANLRCEYKTNPLGIGETKPRLSWELSSDARGVVQTAWQVRVAASEQDLARGKKLLWDSGMTDSRQSNQVEYQGAPLASRQRCYWQVRVWDNQGNASAWSDPAWWEMGLLAPADWKAGWVEPGWDEDSTRSQPCPMLRKSFRLNGKLRSARVYASAHGLYTLELNGKKVGDQVFTPGWTSYHNRLQYQTYDVTALLQTGENALGAILGDGWWRGFIGWGGHRNHYGSRLALLLQLEVTYTDGRTETIGTDGSWKGATGPIQNSDIYNGEAYDARKEQSGWSDPGFNDTDWTPVRVASYGYDKLVAPAGMPVRRISEITPIAILHTPNGETVYDLGQNMVGWVRLRVSGPAGTEIVLTHAEVLDKDGNFYTENLRSAQQKLTYTLRGTGVEQYEPHFTFMGFRYVRVEGLTSEPTPDLLTGIVIHSDLQPAGNFECSNPLVNQLQHNIQWGQKGNFLDVPTDCPQRDERLGWTGDAQAFSRTANFNLDCAAFYTKWLSDLAADQKEDGLVPHVIPNALQPRAGGSTGWADASTIVPWNTYLAYGDKRLLEQQYESMKAWVGYMEKEAGVDFLWDSGPHFGDWLFYSVNNDCDGKSAVTDKYFLTQAFFAHSTDLLRKTAERLGKKEDAAYYTGLLNNIKMAFYREFITPSGRLSSNTQTAYVLALAFDLFPENMRQQAAERLVENIHRYNDHLTTGFLGTPHINHVLTRYGHTDLAYTLLLQDTWPSWLYPVKMGATTIWERWDGIRPDSSFQATSMNSFNHYAYGAIGDWLYRTVAGIDIDEMQPGYKHILIAPQPGGGLSYAKAWHHTPYGRVASEWHLDNGVFRLQVSVPPNSTATVRLPGAKTDQVRESGNALATSNGIRGVRQAGNDVEVVIGSGEYGFEYLMK